MRALLTYTGREGERELALLERPDAPGRLLLLDAPARGSRTDDILVVDDELTTPAEARIVADGWAAEHAAGPITAIAAPNHGTGAPATGEARELARYRSVAGERVVVGQRIRGTVYVSDLPAGDTGTVVLVQRGVASSAELDALVSDYVAESERRGEPARRIADTLVDDLAGALTA